MTLPIDPNGFYVLIEEEKVEEKSMGGIILAKKDVQREQEACDIGIVRAIGNLCFIGMPMCNPADWPPSSPFHDMKPYQIWGIDIGDKVEYRRFEGKVSGIEGCERLRYIPDSCIIGKVREF